MGTKITADPIEREFIVTLAPDGGGIIPVNIRTDLYSDMKEDWLVTSTLDVMIFPITPIGGQQAGSLTIGDTYLITDGWTIRPYEADHTLQLQGNVVTDDGRELVEDTVGLYRVRVENEISALVEIRSGMDAADALTRMDKLNDGVYGQKVLQDATVPATDPGYMILWDEFGVLIGHKEIYEDHVLAGDASNKGYTQTGRGIAFEGPLTAGLPPP